MLDSDWWRCSFTWGKNGTGCPSISEKPTTFLWTSYPLSRIPVNGLLALRRLLPPPTFIFLKFSRAISIYGVSIQPVTTREPLLLSAMLFSVVLTTSGDLTSLNLCGSTLDPHPVCLSCYKKQSCLTFSFSCQRWGETHRVCSRGQPHNDCYD